MYIENDSVYKFICKHYNTKKRGKGEALLGGGRPVLGHVGPAVVAVYRVGELVVLLGAAPRLQASCGPRPSPGRPGRAGTANSSAPDSASWSTRLPCPRTCGTARPRRK